MRIVVIFVVGVLFGNPAWSGDRLIGAVAPDGGAVLVKEFTVPGGATVSGIRFVSNDLATVFPKVALLRGPVHTLRGADVLAELTNVATEDHAIEATFPSVRLATGAVVLVAITLPPSDGVQRTGTGAAITATQIEAPANCYFASSMDAALGAMDVDYDLALVFAEGVQKAGEGSDPPTETRGGPTTFLRVQSPNHGHGQALVTFGIERSCAASLTVYDVTGRQVRLLARESLAPGLHVREWNGRDDQGQQVAASIYLVRLGAGEKTLTQKIVIAR